MPDYFEVKPERIKKIHIQAIKIHFNVKIMLCVWWKNTVPDAENLHVLRRYM